MISCPQCGSESAWKNGHRNGYQRWLCKNCGREYVERGQNNSEPIQRVQSNLLSTVKPNLFLAAADEKFAERQICVQSGTKKGEIMSKQILSEKSDLLSEFPEGLKAKLLQFMVHRENNNKKYKNIVWALKSIVRAGGELRDPESVKAAVKKMAVQESTKKTYCDNYEVFLRFLGGTWEKPRYAIEQKQHFIPTEAEIDQLIAGFSSTLATFCQIAKDTGGSKGEIIQLRWSDVDFEQKNIKINFTTKRHATRTIKVSEKCLNMINQLPRKGEKLFASRKSIDKSFWYQRKKLARKLNNPRLMQLSLHTFRHWAGTMEYHKTHSLGHVAQKLGHKNWKNTQIYITLEELYFGQLNDEFYTEVAKTSEEARKLFESGWEYTNCDFDGVKIFRKRK